MTSPADLLSLTDGSRATANQLLEMAAGFQAIEKAGGRVFTKDECRNLAEFCDGLGLLIGQMAAVVDRQAAELRARDTMKRFTDDGLLKTILGVKDEGSGI